MRGGTLMIDESRFASGMSAPTRLGAVRRTVLISAMLVIVVATYVAGRARRMDTVVPQRHWIYGIPVAVSKDL
jgi:hypothetical protein